jgi:hypothetical protein
MRCVSVKTHLQQPGAYVHVFCAMRDCAGSIAALTRHAHLRASVHAVTATVRNIKVQQLLSGAADRCASQRETSVSAAHAAAVQHRSSTCQMTFLLLLLMIMVLLLVLRSLAAECATVRGHPA